MLPEYEPVEIDWEHEFPGDTTTLTALRKDLHHSDRRRYYARLALDALERELEAIHLPAHHWNCRTRDSIKFLEHRYYRAHRTFQSALKLLVRLCALQKASAVKTSAEKAPSPPEEPKRKPWALHTQTAEIGMLDGQPVTTIPHFDNAYWLAQESFPEGSLFRRQLVFENSFVPEPYAYAMLHDGEPCPPARVVYFYYSQQEFLRLCQLEIETNSPHFLPGEYLNREYLP